MKIYTKKGDAGKTQLLGGTKTDKHDDRIEAYGNVDELNAFIGHIHDQKIRESHKEMLLFIQNKLFCIGSNKSIMISDKSFLKSEYNLP